jgi:hypothetical protein
MLKSAIQNLEEPLSPTGLSSSSSSFTSNLIAQRFNIAADDPILNSYLGEGVEQKGSLVENFFSHVPLHQKQRQSNPAKTKTFMMVKRQRK